VTFEQAMRLAGLRPRDIVPDGRWRRCATDDKPRKRNGAYVLYHDGRGFFKNWATDAELNSWRDDQASPARLIDPEVIRQRRDEERQRRMRGVHAARELWSEAATFRGHAYLTGKGLIGSPLLRTWRGRVWIDQGEKIDDVWLLAPLYWRGKLINVQRISSAGVKRQMKDAPQRAACLVLERARAGLTVFAEGLATGLAVHQCVRHARVVVCYFADNLLPVAQELKPSGNVVFAADNDYRTARRIGTNPGIEKAANAAELFGAGVAWPRDIEGSDWADALKEWGDGGAKRIEREIQAASKFVVGATA
jgi:putative DNA primase/helicase